MKEVFVCPPDPAERLPLSARLAVGFGSVVVSRDDDVVWEGDDWSVLLRRFERLARADPDHDWRVRFIGPLSGETYKRDTGGRWLLIERDEGFA